MLRAEPHGVAYFVWQRKSQQMKTTVRAKASEVLIRRLPPDGLGVQPCGPLQFEVPRSPENEPQNILEEIIWHKAREVTQMRERTPLPKLQMQIKTALPARNFIETLQETYKKSGKPALIAEVKKASPSKGVICENFNPIQIAKAYEAGGAACLSVLTDSKYFQGSFQYLADIRSAGVSCPLLCKEFIVEAYQIMKARAAGADCVLLIAAVLPNKDLDALIKVAGKLSLQCLVEVHSIAELERVLQLKISPTQCMLGINNRDLQTFAVDLNNNKVIMGSTAGKEALSRGFLFAGESGIFTAAHLQFVKSAGCNAVLVGESLVRSADPQQAVKDLLSDTG